MFAHFRRAACWLAGQPVAFELLVLRTHSPFARSLSSLQIRPLHCVTQIAMQAFLRHYARLAPQQRSHALQQLQASGAASKARSLVSGVIRGQL